MAITQSKWRAGLLVTLGAMLFGFVTAFGAPFVSPFVTDWRLDSEVIGVAMDWRDFGEEKAKQRLAFELERQRLSSHVVYEDCTFSIEPQKGYVLSCLWDVVVVHQEDALAVYQEAVTIMEAVVREDVIN